MMYKTMLFEAACFDGTNIRLSSKRIGLRTDASGKFEKGLDPNNAKAAIDRACQLMEELGAGEVVGGTVDVYAMRERTGSRVPFEPDTHQRTCWEPTSAKEQMLGVPCKPIELEYDAEDKRDRSSDLPSGLFTAWQIWQRKWQDSSDMTISRPHFREERLPQASFRSNCALKHVARDIAEFCGFSQGMTYSFESPKVFDKLAYLPEDHVSFAEQSRSPIRWERITVSCVLHP